ncbi:hypothetical protein KVR01_003185 [Diaporthe batatas]|uniref:uncharacterized protein n=1 Tax=Diaporthe batatas TaxID=748121 RepID=UPI001D04F340|nr:uncharacterized protein KVR01_003185 [Diaporthe batatas]KAG8167496.1 hypothetical protein KVR01_003185 [Diaporthe batatas]
MEHALRCNDIKCRVELRDRALVTTCSHIFCVDCVSRSGFNGIAPEHRRCPACQTQLPRPDDAMITNLNPSEDYKTSVLSGLSPEAIMECAGRALSFWSYQMTQDLTWEAHRCKVLTSRYSELSTTLDNIIGDANAQLTALQNKVASMNIDHDNLRRKNEELVQAYKEKNRKLLQTQELYDKLKRKAMLGHIQDAASDAVDTTLQGASSYAAQQADHGVYEHQIGTPLRSAQYGERSDRPGSLPVQPQMMPPDPRAGTWAAPVFPQGKLRKQFPSPRDPNDCAAGAPMTPMKHRQPPGVERLGLSAVPGMMSGTPVPLHGSGRARQPLRELQHNPRANTESFTGVGLSSHLKTSQGLVGSLAAATRPPRVAQRPGVPAFGATAPQGNGSEFRHAV